MRRAPPLDPEGVIHAEGVQVTVGPVLERAVLRGEAAGLPKPVGATLEQGESAVLCLGPDEWLALGPLDLAGPAAVDVGHRQVALLVTGPRAATLLNAGCPLDLHPSAFPAGRCTRTLLAKAEIVLWRRGEERFHVEVARSFAAYAWAFLQEAALGLPHARS